MSLIHFDTAMYRFASLSTKTMVTLVFKLSNEVCEWREPTSQDYRDQPWDSARAWEDKLVPYKFTLQMAVTFAIAVLPSVAQMHSDFAGICWLFVFATTLFLSMVAANRETKWIQAAIHNDNTQFGFTAAFTIFLGIIGSLIVWFAPFFGSIARSNAPPQFLSRLTNQYWICDPEKTIKPHALELRPSVQPIAPAN
jgi:hypothetical protein